MVRYACRIERSWATRPRHATKGDHRDRSGSAGLKYRKGLTLPRPNTDGALAVKVKDACRLTGLSHGTIYKLINDGTLRRSKVGRTTLIPVADLEALIENGIAQ